MSKLGASEQTITVRDASDSDMERVQAIYALEVLHGTFKSVGFKLGTWVDTVLMQRELGAGDSKPAESDGDPAGKHCE